MNINLQNLITEYSSLTQLKPNSPDDFRNLALKIQSLSQLLKLYFRDETYEILKDTEFRTNFNAALSSISDDDCNNFINSINKKNYSAEDLVTLLDANLIDEQKMIAIILCSEIEYYLKLNTYASHSKET
jgi:hypothetical protein